MTGKGKETDREIELHHTAVFLRRDCAWCGRPAARKSDNRGREFPRSVCLDAVRGHYDRQRPRDAAPFQKPQPTDCVAPDIHHCGNARRFARRKYAAASSRHGRSARHRLGTGLLFTVEHSHHRCFRRRNGHYCPRGKHPARTDYVAFCSAFGASVRHVRTDFVRWSNHCRHYFARYRRLIGYAILYPRRVSRMHNRLLCALPRNFLLLVVAPCPPVGVLMFIPIPFYYPLSFPETKKGCRPMKVNSLSLFCYVAAGTSKVASHLFFVGPSPLGGTEGGF